VYHVLSLAAPKEQGGSGLRPDTTRWKLYGKIAAVLGAPVYVGLLALVIEAAKKWLGL